MNLLGDDLSRGRGAASAGSSGSWSSDPLIASPNIAEELQGLAAKGFTAPLARRSQSKQGEEEANVHLLQTVWCRYAGQDISQPTNIWSASLSNLAAAQALEPQQAQRQRQQAPHLPNFSSKLTGQHATHVHTKDLVQDQLRLHSPESFVDIGPPPPVPQRAGGGSLHLSQDVWSKAAWIQNSHASVKSVQQDLQASVKSAQQELAELLGGSHVEGSTAYDMSTNTEQHQHSQQHSDWGGGDTPPALPAMQLPADQPGPDRSLLPLSPIASRELSQFMSWSQLDSPDKAHKLQHQHQEQQLPLPAGAPQVDSSPMSPLGVMSDTWWSQQSSQLPARLDSLPCSAHRTHCGDNVTHCNTLGLGQYAMEAATGPPSTFLSQGEQPAVPEWLQAVQADTARAVRPRHSVPQDFLHPTDLPRLLPFHGSASHPGREDSGDLSTTVGTQMFMGRITCSGTQGRAGAREGVLPSSMASPKSSLGSSLPSLPASLAQVAPSNKIGGNCGVQGGQPSPTKLLMQLVAAPSMFSLPLCAGKLLSPPFRVRVAMLSELPTKLPLTLKAYVLTKDNLNTLEQWHPAHHVVTEAVNGGEVTQTVLCNEGQGELGAGGGAGATGLDGEPAGLLGGVADFVFRDLKFTTTSRMKPRWLVIAAVLPTQDVMYVQYNVPTIIMSRSCDQLPKAMATLNGVQRTLSGAAAGAKKRTRPSSSPSKINSQDLAKHSFPTLQSSSMAEHESDDSLDWPTTGPFTYHRWHVMIERKYNAFNLVRPLCPDDLLMMEQVAGFHESGHQSGGVSELTPHQWAFFGVWYLSYLRIFRCHQSLWVMQSPTAICGFGMDRQRAVHLLADQPVGTFLVRPGLSLAGCMVISAAVAGGGCKHMALDSTQLQSRSLEVWVRDVLEAQQVLDYQTGQRYSKSQVFQVHYQRFGVVSDRPNDSMLQQGQAASRPHRLGLPPLLHNGP